MFAHWTMTALSFSVMFNIVPVHAYSIIQQINVKSDKHCKKH